MSSPHVDPITDGREAAFADRLIDDLAALTYSPDIAPAIAPEGIDFDA